MTERRYLHLNLVANDINLHQGAYAFEQATRRRVPPPATP